MQVFLCLVIPILLNNQSNNKTIQEIKQICQKEKINKIIVGRPVCLDGKISSQTKRTDFFIDQLKKEIRLPIDVADERLTSKIAKQLTGRDDEHSVSAMIILRDYLSRNYLVDNTSS